MSLCRVASLPPVTVSRRIRVTTNSLRGILMASSDDLSPKAANGISRRTVVKGAAWTVPAVIIATAAPAAATATGHDGRHRSFRPAPQSGQRFERSSRQLHRDLCWHFARGSPGQLHRCHLDRSNMDDRQRGHAEPPRRRRVADVPSDVEQQPSCGRVGRHFVHGRGAHDRYPSSNHHELVVRTSPRADSSVRNATTSS